MFSHVMQIVCRQVKIHSVFRARERNHPAWSHGETKRDATTQSDGVRAKAPALLFKAQDLHAPFCPPSRALLAAFGACCVAMHACNPVRAPCPLAVKSALVSSKLINPFTMLRGRCAGSALALQFAVKYSALPSNA